MMHSRMYKGVQLFAGLLKPIRAKASEEAVPPMQPMEVDEDTFDPANSEDEWDDDDDD
ncbi:MAG: hypothetical protein ACI4MJ_08760 [Aristaeellaceae bacterium]